jgi:L-ascorbate metabolism protein UlaG (beta-lactamase superfamily)
VPTPSPNRLTWVGHATILLELGATRMLTDPVLRARVAHLRRQSAPARIDLGGVHAVLVSHLHRDHADGPSLRRIGPTTPILVPRGAGRTLRRIGVRNVREVRLGESVELAPGVRATAVPAVHDGRRTPLARPADAIGWIVDAGLRVYFAGDSDVFEGMRSFAGDVDVALLPIWGWGPTIGPGHMGPREAAQATALIGPRTVIPIHWGTFLPVGLGGRHRELMTSPAREFAALCADLAPETDVVVMQPGESTDLPHDPR